MAKKKNRKQYKQKVTTDKRVDMRTGGRVKLRTGGRTLQEEGRRLQPTPDADTTVDFNAPRQNLKPINAEIPIGSIQPVQPTEDEIVTGGPVGPGVPFDPEKGDGEVGATTMPPGKNGDPIEDKKPPNGENEEENEENKEEEDVVDIPDVETPPVQGQGQAFNAARGTTSSQARRERIARTEAETEARAAGKVPEAAVIPDAEQVDENIEQDTTTMAEPTTVEGTTAQGVTPETVTTGDVTTAAQVEDIKTKKAKVDTIDEKAKVKAATNEEDVRLAEAAEVADVEPIVGADVEIEEGAIADRVVGKISRTAKATAAKNAGTSLERITRAKKQLSRAGLSDADIAEIGNDPEALEDRLADFSEEERGLIEGLPEEALVSTQLNGLLEGMENGEIPPWASPAVAQVEQMLAARGLTASSVGRDALFNAIIQSAMPIAQSNAQALQQSIAQQRDIEARVDEANAQRQQQVGLQNAQNVFNMNMAQFNADQQTELSNSKFMQTVSLTNASNDQQAAVQNAVLASQRNIAEANLQQQAEIANAQNFLKIDLANLNNEQQANVLEAQLSQQRILSNQAAVNASRQFNATNEQQMNQFTMNLAAQTEQFNKSQLNAMEQFNATQTNAAAARDANRAVDVQKFNNQLAAQIDQFNSNQDFARNQWNAQNRAVVEQSNTQWRRQVNTANTAMQNQINAQNAQNAFAMTQTAQSFLWQELRDQADYDFRSSENEKNRISALVNTALASDPEKYGSSVNDIKTLISLLISGTS